MAILNRATRMGALMLLAIGMRGGISQAFERRQYWPLPNYRGSDDRSPERLAAAEAKRARKRGNAIWAAIHGGAYYADVNWP